MYGKKKRAHYGIILACLIVSAIGFGTVYGIEESRQKKVKAESQQAQEKTASQVADILNPKSSQVTNQAEKKDSATTKNSEKKTETQPDTSKVDEAKKKESEKEPEKVPEKTTEPVVETIANYGISRPIDTEVLMDYSMDQAVYFATLNVYKCNPAMIYSAKVNDKVSIVAKGVIKNIFESEETGTTVVEDLGGGFEAVYGQLQSVNFKVGDEVEAGHVVGQVKEPTKYYVKEGANVFFQLNKDGVAVDPKDYFH